MSTVITGSVVTAAVLVILLLSVQVWDVVAVLCYGREATISNVLQGWSRQYPILTLAIGIVLGHLFWPQNMNAPSIRQTASGGDVMKDTKTTQGGVVREEVPKDLPDGPGRPGRSPISGPGRPL
jgi:hypothetical protein